MSPLKFSHPLGFPFPRSYYPQTVGFVSLPSLVFQTAPPFLPHTPLFVQSPQYAEIRLTSLRFAVLFPPTFIDRDQMFFLIFPFDPGPFFFLRLFVSFTGGLTQIGTALARARPLLRSTFPNYLFLAFSCPPLFPFRYTPLLSSPPVVPLPFSRVSLQLMRTAPPPSNGLSADLGPSLFTQIKPQSVCDSPFSELPSLTQATHFTTLHDFLENSYLVFLNIPPPPFPARSFRLL